MLKTSMYKNIDEALFEKIRDYAIKEELLTFDQTVIIGFSGGPDSLLLLYWYNWLKSHYNLQIIIAHLDHQWRERSVQDAQWCQQVAEQMHMPFILGHAKDIVLNKKSYGSQEDEGRRKRRMFFEGIASRFKNSRIALGHHADDQQETFFIRLLRGAGVTGLAGIKPKDGYYIRPLLCCSKQELISWLTEHEIFYLTDETNQDDSYLRNRIRNKVIPALRDCDARFGDSLKRTMNNLRETDEFLSTIIQEKLSECSIEHNLNLELFLKQPAFLQKQILLQWFIQHNLTFTPSAHFFNEIMRFLSNIKSDKHLLYASWWLIKKNNFLSIQSKD